MISKLRFKFIAISMLSMLAVLALIIAGINIINYAGTVSDADETLDYLAANSGEFPAFGGMARPEDRRPGEDRPGEGTLPDTGSRTEKEGMVSGTDSGRGRWNGRRQPDGSIEQFEKRMSPEFPFESRYFSVFFDGGMNVRRINTERISAVDSGDALDYAEKVLATDKERGFMDSDRMMPCASF